MLRTAAYHLRNAINTYRSTGESPSGVPLPPKSYRMGGCHFEDDTNFVNSAMREVARLEEHGMSRTSHVLDWGCGAGRLAVGLQERWGQIGSYHGVDVQKPLIRWARRHLAGGTYRFTHIDAANDRYNPDGSCNHRIPGRDGAYDVIYAYSVFSHMTGEDVRAYFGEIRRLLRLGGFTFFTAFVEDDVEPEAENPPGYGTLEWSGRLHCVRYEQGRFRKFIEEAGLTVTHFEHGTETDGQSLFVAS